MVDDNAVRTCTNATCYSNQTVNWIIGVAACIKQIKQLSYHSAEALYNFNEHNNSVV